MITEPVSVAQYGDAVVIYLHGFDVARGRYPNLQLKYRFILPDGTVGDGRTLDLTNPWEKPAIIVRKGNVTYAGIVITARSGANVFFRRLYSLNGSLEPQTLVTTLAQDSVIELGEFVSEAPRIPLPDRSQFDSTALGTPPRSVNIDTGSLQVVSDINYPQVSSGQLCALSRQTDFPHDESKRSLYIPLKSQLYDQVTGHPAGVAHYLCEIPLDENWLNGTEDLAISLTASQIKVHRSDLTDGGTNILGGGGGGLGQGTGTMDVDADGNIYFSNSVPSDVVRFNVYTATFEVPPIDLLELSNRYLPTDDEILGDGSTDKNGRWQTYRMVANMNHSEPKRMLFGRTISRLIFDGTLYEWSALFTLPKDHWNDVVAFTNDFRLLVGSWPSAEYSFYDTLPVENGPNRRIQYFRSYGNTVYAQPYPGSVGGPWRVDVSSSNTVEAFGTPDTLTNYNDGTSQPRDVKPYNAAGKVTFTDYGLLTMERKDLNYCLTGTNDNSLTGLIEVNYDAIAHMIENSAAFAPILNNLGGPSLAPSYMATPLPGQNGKVLGVGEYGYYLAEFDLNQVTPGSAEKDYLVLDSPDPNVDLPLAVGLGPYGYQWVDLDGDDWLYVGGYTGLTRLKYRDNGAPLQRYAMDKFHTRLATVNLDAAGYGPIKRFRYMQHGLDDRLFLTGTHTAARGGTAYSGGLLSFHKRDLDTLWRQSYMSRSYGTVRLRNRVIRDVDGIPVQEFCAIGSFNPEYAHTIASELVPTNHDAKLFMWDYKSGGQMRDLMGFSQAPLDGSTGVSDIAYSQDRRYLIIRQGNQILTFDPQANRFIDGKDLRHGSDIRFNYFQRPSSSFTRAPDDRLFLYVRPAENSTNATFVEIQVSPTGALSFHSYLELHTSSSTILDDTFETQHTFLPDLANNDGSFDLFLGQQLATSGGGTTCRLIEDFVPPRRHSLSRTLNVLSKGNGGVSITGSKPGMTPYSAATSDAQSITLTASPSADFVFKEWQGEDGNVLSTATTLLVGMTEDRILTAVYVRPPPNATNLVVSEIHYRPAPPTTGESSAGHDSPDQFEYLELLNTGSTTLDLSTLSFTEGITFDFASNQFQNLPPGNRVLVTANQEAFVRRYGSNQLSRIAGNYTGNLSDTGERLVLMNSNDTVIHSFAYDDQPPWPETANGNSLILIAPNRPPPVDLGDPINWRSSMTIGGTPGFGQTGGYASWITSNGIAANEPILDPDNDGRPNIVEYLQNSDPNSPNQVSGMTAAIESMEIDGNTNPYFVFRILRRIDADDLEILVDTSGNLSVWIPNQTIFLGRHREANSPTEWLRYRSANPINGLDTSYVRLRVRQR